MSTDSARDLVESHLGEALDADEPSEKNYHVRSALQALAIES